MEKIRTKVLIETHEVSIIKRKRTFLRGYCDSCRREVSLISPHEAAFLVCRGAAEIYSWMDSNKVHFLHFDGDKPFICLTSLCSVDESKNEIYPFKHSK